MKAIAIFGTAALAATLFAGAALSETAAGATLEGTQWDLVMLGTAETSQGVDSTLNFGTENDIGGNGGCNVFGGSVSFADDGTLDIENVFSTMMACEEPKMSQERAFFDALEAATDYTLADGQLTLSGEDGAVLAVLVPASD